MMVSQASTYVSAPLERLKAVVLDPQAYSKSDTKVDTIVVEEKTPDGMVARIHGRLGPFRSSILARYTIGERKIDLDMLEGRLRGFHAVFELEPEAGRVRLTHREEYDFGYGPLTPLVELALKGWARRSIEAEVESLRLAAEAE